MGQIKRILFVVALALFCGLTIRFAGAQSKSGDVQNKQLPADKTKGSEDAKKLTNEQVRQLLLRPSGFDQPLEGITLKEIIAQLSERFDVPIRIDAPAFIRRRPIKLNEIYTRTVSVPVVRGMSVADLLHDVLARVNQTDSDEGPGFPITFGIRDGQILIVPSYIPPFQSGTGPMPDGAPRLPLELVTDQIEGEPILASFHDKSLAEILDELRRVTGANIVLDPRANELAKQSITASLNDVRLYSALRILCDTCNLKPIEYNGIYYVTLRDNAMRLQREIDGERFGETTLRSPPTNPLAPIPTNTPDAKKP